MYPEFIGPWGNMLFIYLDSFALRVHCRLIIHSRDNLLYALNIHSADWPKFGVEWALDGKSSGDIIEVLFSYL